MDLRRPVALRVSSPSAAWLAKSRAEQSALASGTRRFVTTSDNVCFVDPAEPELVQQFVARFDK